MLITLVKYLLNDGKSDICYQWNIQSEKLKILEILEEKRREKSNSVYSTLTKFVL